MRRSPWTPMVQAVLVANALVVYCRAAMRLSAFRPPVCAFGLPAVWPRNQRAGGRALWATSGCVIVTVIGNDPGRASKYRLR
jgi:hypothetical protein